MCIYYAIQQNFPDSYGIFPHTEIQQENVPRAPQPRVDVDDADSINPDDAESDGLTSKAKKLFSRSKGKSGTDGPDDPYPMIAKPRGIGKIL